MNAQGTWDLSRIYKGFDDPAYIADFETMKQKVGEYAAFTEKLEEMDPLDGLVTGIRM